MLQMFHNLTGVKHMLTNLKRFTSNTLLLAILVNPLSAALADVTAAPSAGARIQKIILESKKMEKRGEKVETIAEYVGQELTGENKHISVEDMKNYIALKYGFNSPQLTKFQELHAAAENTLNAEGDAALLEKQFGEIVSKNESKAAPFLGQMSCWAIPGIPMAAFISAVTGFAVFTNIKQDTANYVKNNSAGYDLRKSDETLRLQNDLSNKLFEAELKKQQTAQLISSPINLDLAIAELQAKKENGLLTVDASSLVYMRADSVSSEGFSILGYSSSSSTIHYSGSSADLYKAVNTVIDINTELRKLQAYRDVMAKYGSNGVTTVNADNQAKYDAAIAAISSSSVGVTYSKQDQLRQQISSYNSGQKQSAAIITAAVTVGAFILTAIIGEATCN
jgi:hypothetical protein